MSVVAYHFWSPTCGPCKIIKPAVEDLKDEFPGVSWVTVNTHDDKNDYSGKFGVSVVPTIVVVTTNSDNTVILQEKHSGTSMAQYYRILRNGVKLST